MASTKPTEPINLPMLTLDQAHQIAEIIGESPRTPLGDTTVTVAIELFGKTLSTIFTYNGYPGAPALEVSYDLENARAHASLLMNTDWQSHAMARHTLGELRTLLNDPRIVAWIDAKK